MSTNPVVSMPDADRVRRALERCDLVVVSDCVRTDTTDCAHVLLPAATWGEKSGTVTNSERRISRQRQFLPPPGESRPDWWIVTEVARRMGFGTAFAYDGPAAIFREHARLSAFENGGTRDFDIGALASLSDQEYDAMEPVQWPRPVERGGRPARSFADGRFYTPTGKARLVATEPRAPRHLPSSEYPLVLNTGRIRDQWHTMTRTGRSPRLSGHNPEPLVQIHPSDAVRAGLAAGDLAEVRNAAARIVVRAEITEDVSPGQVFVPMHWSSRFASAARVGALIAAAPDPVSGQPELKHMPVSVRRYVPAWHGFVLSRAPVAIEGCSYLARAKGHGCWRHELAGESVPASWSEWAADLLGPEGERIELSDASGGRYRAARVIEGRLHACLFVATTKALPSRTWLASLFSADALDDAERLAILAGRAARPGADTGPVVCSCFSIGRGTLLRAIRTQALVSTEQIGEVLRAGTNCGSCVPELRALLAEAVAISA
jgi:assimilatory nitrate reductase catalytic subunit